MDPASARYLIRIKGHLGAALLSAFPAMPGSGALPTIGRDFHTGIAALQWGDERLHL